MSEGSLIGDSVSLTPAHDADAGANSIVRYEMTPQLPEFDLDWGGRKFSSSETDFEETSKMIASMEGSPSSRSAGGSTTHASLSSFIYQPSMSGVSMAAAAAAATARNELRLVIRQQLDREKVPIYLFTLTAFDGGNPPRNGSVQVRVVVTDENDNAPKFDLEKYSVKLKENAKLYSNVVQVGSFENYYFLNNEKKGLRSVSN
ncbi:unnamed protein product [Protopolystoma xenopodis]|uniref:Cadherin domain-containing protein n=1 Tax=Protopolystoma xenopodis TaxID=117903 RepID=A0A3S5FEJ8_9PLAT|nr:unnamed protein product [Protopolystoma xenopodis]